MQICAFPGRQWLLATCKQVVDSLVIRMLDRGTTDDRKIYKQKGKGENLSYILWTCVTGGGAQSHKSRVYNFTYKKCILVFLLVSTTIKCVFMCILAMAD